MAKRCDFETVPRNRTHSSLDMGSSRVREPELGRTSFPKVKEPDVKTGVTRGNKDELFKLYGRCSCDIPNKCLCQCIHCETRCVLKPDRSPGILSTA